MFLHSASVVAVQIVSGRINERVFEYIDYTRLEVNHYSNIFNGFVISLHSSVGSCYHV